MAENEPVVAEPQVAETTAPPAETPAEQEQPTLTPEQEIEKLVPTEEKPEETPAPPAAEPSPKEEKPVGEEEKPAEEAPKPELSPEQVEAESALPENVRKAFGEVPELRGVYFREKQYAEIYGSLENAKHVHAEYDDLQETDRLFTSPEKSDQVQFLQGMQEQFPEAYNRVLGVVVESTFKQYAQDLRGIYNRGDLADALDQINAVFLGDGAQSQPATGVDARERALEVREQALSSKETAGTQQRASEFQQGVQGAWEKRVDSHITERVKELLGDKSLPKWHASGLRRNVLERVGRAIENNPIFQDRLLSQVQSGDFSDEHRESLVNMIFSEFSSSLSSFVQEELAEAGPLVVQQSEERQQAVEARTARGKEPGAGTAHSTPKKTPVADMKPKEGETEQQFVDRLYKELAPTAT